MQQAQKHILAISGGVGGAKLALGLAAVLESGQLTIVANTGDDFEHLGLHIAPDLDTVMYTLAGISNTELGWGLAGESWNFLEALGRLGGDDWFRLGDRDLATHVLRSQGLAAGKTLSQITRQLCEKLGVAQRLLPMSDDAVRTVVSSDAGELPFQHYFVRLRCEPLVTGFQFKGLEQALPQPEMMALLAGQDLGAVVICPSNPFVSVDPVLSLRGVREALADSVAPVIAVSPIVAGLAIKGPAAKMMAELGMPVSALAVARHYRGLVDCFVLDAADATLAPEIEELGMEVLVTNTVMRSLEDRRSLAGDILQWTSQR
jgi:LPPG:FO 2-phospho-L-lactate transferase